MRSDNNRKNGFTLLEIVVAAGIMVSVLVGVLAAYITSMGLIEMARNTTYALMAAQRRIEDIRDHNFSSVSTDYAAGKVPGDTFILTSGNDGIDGQGKIEIDDNPIGGMPAGQLLQITVTIAWKQKSGRIIGGDAALNPLPTSPVRLVTYVTYR
ncbi:MAG: prepilin-type N-terminal cleavage/methylation domain-containing protein [Candidatus Omnitrophota bacterium]